MLAVVVVFVLGARASMASFQHSGSVDQNRVGMFPGKATWGPSPLAGGSLSAGIGSPDGSPPHEILPDVRPEGTKVVGEVKVGYPSLSTVTQIPSRQPHPPLPNPGYTVGGSGSPVGRLVVLPAGISGDSPFVITRQRGPNSKRIFGSITKRLK